MRFIAIDIDATLTNQNKESTQRGIVSGATSVVDYGDFMYVEDVFNNTIGPFNVLQYEAGGVM